MDTGDLQALFNNVGFDEWNEAARSESQSLLLVKFHAVGCSSRLAFKKAPQIVEGDAVDCKLTLKNLRESSFPGGELLVVVLYSINQHQGPPKIKIPKLEGKEEITFCIGRHDALSAGVAKVFLMGRTTEGQRAMFAVISESADASPVVIPVSRSIYRFRVWPLSSIYSLVAIVLAAFSLAMSALAVLISIW